MGEATYYAKARFKSEEDLASKMGKIEEFIKEGRLAYEFWQGNRGENPSDFWPIFKEKFPEVFDYLHLCKEPLNDCNNSLAGKLDFGYEYSTPEQDGDVWLFYTTVWHVADWYPFMDYLETKFGAVKTAWLSDECLDPFDSLTV